jgi:hypothetical protein
VTAFANMAATSQPLISTLNPGSRSGYAAIEKTKEPRVT